MKLVSISGQECKKVLESAGFYFVRQKGSHIIMRKSNPFYQLVIPDHKALDKGTLRAIIKQSGLSVEEFNERLAAI